MAALTEEQSMLRDQAKSWVTEQFPVQKFREMRDSGVVARFTPETWQGMIEMGWTGILVPEQYGGSGLGYLTFGVVLEEIGRQLTASPLFASAYVGATAVMLGGSDDQKQAILPKVVDGSVILTLAVDEGPRHDPAKIALKAESTGSGYQLSGNKTFVVEGMAATDFIVAASIDDDVKLLHVPASADGVSREAMSMVDSRGYANVHFDGVEVGAEAVMGDAAVLEQVLDCARAGIGAEMLGTASQAFDMTLDYLKTRVQFGQVIGSFQALGHRAAELFGQMELSRSCMEAALQGIDADADDVSELASLSKAKVGDFIHEMSNQLIQIHGGIGMTDEFDAGFYLKRARVLEAAYGNQAFHRDRYARLLGF
ncbi:MAG: acyl-CoA dehydrogenase family protein [Pseudomonadales bacterium]|nr:acyl-CoA dehydrogenase family protein [Pseudomonadales bacterium]MBO6565007.1 acyl-CoA dehydrogenase family protein [Pseudomonadales bacterium]MBO6594907.1 acyl-CoA dehydrogenase family protein [Pseudomonadales bacterium]MBO6658292.1 acyl-CoA dehydrogenase family protein [Pseudomonadales bacterium]MBO6701413.1 acyl-CoA dehydrogenase family protein [Pseudomonadales bacterium]